MFNNEQSKRESLLALILIFSCLACFIIGLFILKPKDIVFKQDKTSKIVDSLIGDRVSVIALEGIIYDTQISRTPFKTVLNSAYVKDELEEAIKDKHIKAVLLRMNSPGGTVAASQEIYELVRMLVEKNKPVVVSMGDVCASGCYYIASAASEIISNSGTLTGSIGVISQGFNYQGLMEKLGLQDQTFKSGKYKDLGSGRRDMTAKEQEILQALLDDSYDQFLTDIVLARNIEREELEKKAQGIVYTGRQALNVGIIDKIGSYNDSILELRKILKSYGYDKYDSIEFIETWNKSNISSLDKLIDFGFSNYLNKFLQDSIFVKIFDVFFHPLNANPTQWDSKFKIMWIMS